MIVKDIFENLVEKIKQSPEGLGKLKAIYQFDISGSQAGTYQFKVEEQTVEWAEGTPFEAECTLSLSDDNFLMLVQGKLNPTVAYMTGKLKVNGDLGLALKLQSVLEHYA